MTAHGLDLKARLDSLVARAEGVWIAEACGVTRSETPIPTLVHRDAYSATGDKTRVLLAGGLSGRSADVESALSALDLYLEGHRDGRLALSAVPCANPDGLRLNAAPGNGAGGFPDRGYPPVDGYFDHSTDPEARYLWRWACFQGPDLVLEVRDGPSVSWEVNDAATALVGPLGAGRVSRADSLIAALAAGSPSGLAAVPGVRLTAPRDALKAELERLWSALSDSRPVGPSPAGRALEARRGRSPIDVARVLASAYGHTLSPVVYTQGVAISGRLRLAELDPEGYDPVRGIASLVEPLVSPGNDPFGDEPGTPDLAGLLWGDELAVLTGDRRYAGLVVGVADRYVPAGPGEAPPPSDPDFRTEDMFMNGAMLGRAFAITGDRRYIDLLTRFLLDARVQQDDGLFWHCRSVPYYWGRGNGFAAMGFAETLTYLPEDHPDRDALLDIHRRHLRALGRLQCTSGMFRQVLDFPGSYQELTATCMVGYAAARGLRRGWLDASYREMLEGCWRAASERVQDDGKIVDGCAGTGVQSSLREYLDRPAIHGFDDRTGSMAIWFATEMERLRRQAG
jgi:rhamnogalacturonyl hydrolase YesR